MIDERLRQHHGDTVRLLPIVRETLDVQTQNPGRKISDADIGQNQKPRVVYDMFEPRLALMGISPDPPIAMPALERRKTPAEQTCPLAAELRNVTEIRTDEVIEAKIMMRVHK